MDTAAFDYHLLKRAIAQPPARRDRSRLLVLDRATGRMTHEGIRHLPKLLAHGDCIVVNDTKVFRARLAVTVNGKRAELFLVRPDDGMWIALGKPGKRFVVGAAVVVGTLRGVVRTRADDGSFRVAFDRTPNRVVAYANRVGAVPVPPYITGSVQRLADYQTAYARVTGSVAAPTAGFHLTPRLLRALRARGVRIARVTLHVGLSTFQPIRTPRIEEHVMHAEWAEVRLAAVGAMAQSRARGGRIVAVGTTTLRTLEGVAALHRGVLAPHRGFLNCYITPGFHFRVADALLTNFHLPKSSLLVLVSAFAAPGVRGVRGRDRILRAYRSALRCGYRFYSFGDAMLLR